MRIAALGICIGVFACADPAPPPRDAVFYQATNLKAVGSEAALEDFVTTHWFAMDAQGIAAGIFTDYRLLAAPIDEAAWDFVMVVGYPQTAGYDDPRTREVFTAIRTEHEARFPEAARLADVMENVGGDGFAVVAGSGG